MNDFSSDEWLNLHTASEMLGVNSSTVRRWGDAGRLTMMRTMGGHRRFLREDVESMCQYQQPPPKVADVTPTRHWWINTREIMNQDWHTHLAANASTDRMRELGQRLLGMLMQYINRRDESPRLLQEAHEVGTGYGHEASRLNLSMVDVVQAFLYFRRAFARLARPHPDSHAPPQLDELLVVRARLDRFMDEVLLGTIAGFENGNNTQHFNQSGNDLGV